MQSILAVSALCLAVMFAVTELVESHPVVQTLGYSLLQALFGSMLLIVVANNNDEGVIDRILKRTTHLRVLKTCGKYSYGI